MLTMRPTLLIPAVLLAVIPIVAADPSPQATPPRRQLGPAIVQKFNKWNYVGCFLDENGTRTLIKKIITGSPHANTVEFCVGACEDGKFAYAGLEFGEECWCGTLIQAGRTMVDPASCNYACTGNGTQICGGENHLTIYSYTGVYPPSR